MASGDYMHCSACGCKTYYDGDVEYDEFHVGIVVSLCKECSSKYEVKLLDKSDNLMDTKGYIP